MSKKDTCPNCLKPITNKGGACVLHALIGVIRDRENSTAEKLRQLHLDCNVDQLWDDLGPIIDRLENGHYNCAPETEKA